MTARIYDLSRTQEQALRQRQRADARPLRLTGGPARAALADALCSQEPAVFSVEHWGQLLLRLTALTVVAADAVHGATRWAYCAVPITLTAQRHGVFAVSWEETPVSVVGEFDSLRGVEGTLRVDGGLVVPMAAGPWLYRGIYPIHLHIVKDIEKETS